MRLGCHLSIAGGMHHALEKAHELGLASVAVFVRNQRQWRVPALDPAEVETFRRVRARLKISPVVAHGSYLLNLAGSEEVRAKTLDALVADLGRCDRLGIEYLVIHPGACADRTRGLALVAEGLNEVFERALVVQASPPASRRRGIQRAGEDACTTMLLLETTAGSGSALGGTFEQLQAMIEGVTQRQRVGVCLDTCHVFAAGYDIRTREAYLETMARFDSVIGLANLEAVHLNDSLRELGSRVDRHAHIGKGLIGREAFRQFANDKRLADVPMILETPKGLRESDGKDWDEVNVQTMRSLVRKKAT